MDTNDTYFHPGDEELQVWMYIDEGNDNRGYIKGSSGESSGLANIGCIEGQGESKIRWTESIIQQMAETLMDKGVMFFFLRVVSTTSFDVIEAKDVAKYRTISNKHRAMIDITHNDDDLYSMQYHRGVVEGLGVLLHAVD